MLGIPDLRIRARYRFRSQPYSCFEEVPIVTSKDKANSGLATFDRGGALGLRPIAPTHLHVVSTFMGNRPIVDTGLKVASTYGHGRPIEAGPIKVAETFGNNRPIMASTHNIVGTYMGNRPIMSSGLKIAGTYLPGGLFHSEG